MKAYRACLLAVLALVTSTQVPTWAQNASRVLARGESAIEPIVEKNVRSEHPLFELRPTSFPDTMRIGEDWLFRAYPTARCSELSPCRVEWTTDPPEIARWLESKPPCGIDHCAILEPVSPGSAVITVRLCSETSESCQAKVFDLEVIY